VIHAFQKLDICVGRLRHNPGLFEEAAIDQFGAAAEVIENPHNQTPERSRPVGGDRHYRAICDVAGASVAVPRR
jgi:hypothetical protein